MRITVILKYQEGDTIKTTLDLNQELYLLMKRFGYRLMKAGKDKTGRVYHVYSDKRPPHRPIEQRSIKTNRKGSTGIPHNNT